MIILLNTSCTCTRSFSSTLVSSRKQEATASCKTCRGRPLVDGIGSVPAGMMSTVGLELTNFINPDLTWKTVSKGNRSGTRRTRKSGVKSLTVGMGLAGRNAKMVEDVAVSESEKLGVDVLGRRFGDKVEQVPIKKRRFMFRSPSPPPPLTPSPHLEASGQHLDFQPAAGQSSGSKQRQWLTKTDKSTVEDFSGIEILAAAACSDSISDDVTENEGNLSIEESRQDRVESSASAMALEETTASLELASCSPKDSVIDGKPEGSSFQDDSSAVLHESPSDKDNAKAERSIPLPGDRLLWDLNLSMDDWPCDGGNVDYEKDAVDNTAVTSNELQSKEPQDIKNADVNRVDSSEVDGVKKMTSESTNIPVSTEDLTIEKQESEGCTVCSENKTEHVPMPVVNAEKSLMLDTDADTKACSEAVNLNQYLNHEPLPEPDKSTLVCEENQEASILTHNVGQNTVGCISEADVGRTVCVESAQVEDSNVASPSVLVPVLEMFADDIKKTGVNEDGKDHDSNSGLYDPKVLAHDLDKPRPLEHIEVGQANGAEEMDICHSSPKSEDMSISDDCGVEAMGRTDGASSAYTPHTGSVAHDGSEELLQTSSRNPVATLGDTEFSTHEACRIYTYGPSICLDEDNLNDPSNESKDLAISQDKVLTVGLESHSELQAGYDFEDGELRESDAQCWEEAEQVDYDTEFEEERSLGLESESGERKLKVERGSSPDTSGSFKYCETGEALRENSASLKTRTVEVSDGETKKNDCLDESNIRDYNYRVDLSKVSKRELLSRAEGSLPSDAVQRNRSDNLDGSYSRAERDAGSDKFMGRERSASHMRGRSPGGHFFNPSGSYWDSKRHHSPIYHGYNFGRARPKSVVEGHGYPMTADQATSDAAGVARPDNRIGRQFMGSSNGAYRPLLRRRSPVERDDPYCMHTRMATARDTSPDRARFRRYPQGVSRGIRDDYARQISDEGTECFNRMPHRLGRRERSISPHGGRPHYTLPYKKTRSRSRSRSPIGCLLPRDRNEASRRRSRSPDFRSDGRIDRVRMPFTKRFAADYGEEFISPPRSRISPQRNSRMFEDRNAGLDHFRGRKSPVRMFRQGQRFDQVRPMRRLNSDDYFRPMFRPRRFQDMAGGKGCKYDGGDDDKHGSRYEMIHRVRRYDTDGVRRFRYNAEDSYVANNSLTVTNAIGVSSRRPDDAPRTTSEDRSFKMQP